MNETRTYELAGIGDRAIALLIDIVLVSAVGSAVGFNVNLLGGSITSIVFGGAYEWYFLTRQHGQTPGKMLLNLRVIKVDGTPIEDADAIVRYVGYIVGSALAFLGFIWAIFDSDNQGWHDKLASTYVIKVPKGKQKNENVTM